MYLGDRFRLINTFWIDKIRWDGWHSIWLAKDGGLEAVADKVLGVPSTFSLILPAPFQATNIFCLVRTCHGAGCLVRFQVESLREHANFDKMKKKDLWRGKFSSNIWAITFPSISLKYSFLPQLCSWSDASNSCSLCFLSTCLEWRSTVPASFITGALLVSTGLWHSASEGGLF